MKRIAVIALVVVVAAVGGFLAWRMMAPPPADLDLARSKLTDAGLFRVAIEPEAEPLQQGTLHAWIVSVELPDGAPLADARISVDGGMPQHGHGLPTVPEVSEHIGDGRYRIEGVRFNMGGWWVLELNVDAAEGSDSVTFNIML